MFNVKDPALDAEKPVLVSIDPITFVPTGDEASLRNHFRMLVDSSMNAETLLRQMLSETKTKVYPISDVYRYLNKLVHQRMTPRQRWWSTVRKHDVMKRVSQVGWYDVGGQLRGRHPWRARWVNVEGSDKHVPMDVLKAMKAADDWFGAWKRKGFLAEHKFYVSEVTDQRVIDPDPFLAVQVTLKERKLDSGWWAKVTTSEAMIGMWDEPDFKTQPI